MTKKEPAIILLASGLSKRFGQEDKLLSPLNGQPLGSYAASLFQAQRTTLHCAITPANTRARTALYRAHGWHVLTNPTPERGQGSSLAIAANYLLSTKASSALVLLADMPFVTEAYLRYMIDGASANFAVMSQCEDILQPPALFPRSAFPLLARAKGDTGARTIFTQLANTITQPIPIIIARDIDTQAELVHAQAHLPENPLHV